MKKKISFLLTFLFLLIVGTAVSVSAQPCNDSDGGLDIYNYGTCDDSCASYADSCSGNGVWITEYYCRGEYCEPATAMCPDGCCVGGQCDQRGITCQDSDGEDIHTKGSCTEPCDGSVRWDSCGSSTSVHEQYCYRGDHCYTKSIACPSGEVCSDGKCVPEAVQCNDPDGRDYYTQGTCTDSFGFYTDDCAGSLLKEYFCNNDRCSVEYLTCPGEKCCQNGACSNLPLQCSDNDGGLNLSTRGTCRESCTGFEFTDVCLNEHTVAEYYCKPGNPFCRWTDEGCPSGTCCRNGECKAEYCPNKPDLVIDNIWNSGSIIYYRIKNQGAGDADDFSYASLYVDGDYKGHDFTGKLSAHSSTLERFYRYAWNCSGESDSISICADHTNRVSESNENNNCRTETWSCPTTTPSLTPTSTPTPTPTPGTTSPTPTPASPSSTPTPIRGPVCTF